jgi:small-conductance mechanosensitive channel/CRP-like cAMP-binding protein
MPGSFTIGSKIITEAETVELPVILLSCVLYGVGLLVGRFLKRRLRIQLDWTYQIFLVVLAIYLSGVLLRVDFPGRKESGFLALLFGAFPLNAVLHRFFWPLYGYPGAKSRIPTFLPQVAALLLTIACGLAGLASFYHVTITGVLAGSGVIAIIIGLALQETLGNIFAGFGLQAGKTFRVGDWLIVDGQHVEVVEVNWRSTRFRNNDEASINVPNSQLAKSTIINLYYPTPVHAMRVKLGVEYKTPPNEVKDALIKAALSVDGVLADPPPYTFLTEFGESAINYELKFWLRDGRRYPRISEAIRTNCWYEFSRRGIQFAFPVRVLERARSSTRTTEQTAELLGEQALFSSLDGAQLEQLAKSAKHTRFGKEETIIHQGERGESMFILASGSAEVFARKDARLLRVGMLQTGDCFGEVSLLTGEPRSATVVAKSDCSVIEVQKTQISTLLHQHPELAERLSETLAQRRVATQNELERFEMQATENVATQTKESLLARLRLFFEL